MSDLDASQGASPVRDVPTPHSLVQWSNGRDASQGVYITQFNGSPAPKAPVPYVAPELDKEGFDYTLEWVDSLSVKENVKEVMALLIERQVDICLEAFNRGICSSGQAANLLCMTLWWLSRSNSLVVPASARSVALWINSEPKTANQVRAEFYGMLKTTYKPYKGGLTKRRLFASARADEFVLNKNCVKDIQDYGIKAHVLVRQGFLACRSGLWFSREGNEVGYTLNHRFYLCLLLDNDEKLVKEKIMESGYSKYMTYQYVREVKKFIKIYNSEFNQEANTLAHDGHLMERLNLGNEKQIHKAQQYNQQRADFRSLRTGKKGEKIFDPEIGSSELIALEEEAQFLQVKEDIQERKKDQRAHRSQRAREEREMWISILEHYDVRVPEVGHSSKSAKWWFGHMMDHGNVDVQDTARIAIDIRNQLYKAQYYDLPGQNIASMALIVHSRQYTGFHHKLDIELLQFIDHAGLEIISYFLEEVIGDPYFDVGEAQEDDVNLWEKYISGEIDNFSSST